MCPVRMGPPEGGHYDSPPESGHYGSGTPDGHDNSSTSVRGRTNFVSFRVRDGGIHNGREGGAGGIR